MKTVDYNTMVVGYKVSNIDFGNRRCSVTVYGKLSQEPKVINDVYMSGLLVSRMTSEKSMAHYETDKKYSCVNNDHYRKLNPFQLIQYKRDGEFKYYLTLVEDQGKQTVIVGKDMWGNEITKTSFLPFYKKERYLRFRIVTKKQTAAVPA